MDEDYDVDSENNDYGDNDNFDSDDDIKSDNSNKYGEERAVWERVGRPGELFGIDYKNTRDKDTLFIIRVEAISLQLMNDDTLNNKLKINDTDISTIKKMMIKLKHKGYLNPSAYVLGYLVTNNKYNKIDVDMFKFIKNKVLNKLEDKSIKDPDIIRYSRLWINLKG